MLQAVIETQLTVISRISYSTANLNHSVIEGIFYVTIYLRIDLLATGELNSRKELIYIYMYIYKNCRKKAVLLRIKSSSDDYPGFKYGFGSEASLPLTQGTPVVSHNTTRLYWMVFDLYECHIRSDAVTVLFWIFFKYSLFSSGENSSLVKGVKLEFEIKPWHPISRGKMSVDQSF